MGCKWHCTIPSATNMLASSPWPAASSSDYSPVIEVAPCTITILQQHWKSSMKTRLSRNPVHLRDMLLRAHLDAEHSLEYNRLFVDYQKRFGELQKLGKQLLEALKTSKL